MNSTSTSATTHYYAAFLQALLEGRSDDPEVAPLLTQPAFAIYRNTVFKGCVDALAANYPAVQRLVGTPWMQAAALAYARQHLPRQASLIAYGDVFPDFLATLPAVNELPYLPGVAQLDRYWTESHLAADQPQPDVAALHAALAQGRDVRLVLHAATRWHRDVDHPIHSLWEANRRDDLPCTDTPDWHGEGCLLTRPQDQVQWRPLGAGAAGFLDACRHGDHISHAAAQALAQEPQLDIAAMLGLLLQAGAFTTFH